jgi:hypothetical protein
MNDDRKRGGALGVVMVAGAIIFGLVVTPT